MIRVNVHLTPQQVAKLKALTEKNGLTVAEQVRRAIDAYLKKEK